MKKINFKEIAKDAIETEIKSLKKLKLNINKSFDKAVEAILNCKNGKVIISGVGKSGIIGKKISSTFASVGIPSFFADANSAHNASAPPANFTTQLPPRSASTLSGYSTPCQL